MEQPVKNTKAILSNEGYSGNLNSDDLKAIAEILKVDVNVVGKIGYPK